jgi:anti-anti-sigma factor
MSSTRAPATTKQQGVTIVAFGTEYENLDEVALDEGVGDVILESARDADPPLLLIDMSHVKFFGSSFIETLFRAYNRMNEREGKFAICGLTPYCVEVIQVTHLDRMWSIFDSRDAAIEGLSGD